MTNKTGVTLQKTKLLDKTVKTDFKKIFMALSKSAISFCMGNAASGMKDLVALTEAFQLSSTPSDLAYRLILTALVNAAHDLAEESSPNFTTELEEAEELYDVPEYVDFLDGITALITDKELVLEFEMLKNPRSIPILDDFQAYFMDYLVLFGVNESDAELISNRLPSYFVFALNDEWRSNFSKYEPLFDSLNTPVSEAARKERQREAYSTYLEKEVEKPVFGESFSLKDIFIPLRAYHQKKQQEHQETEKTAVWLEESMDQWLASSKREATIKVIQGGPGSGKSSFVKWWTAKIARNRSHSVLFFPLHHFNIHTNIKTAIGEYLKDAENIPLAFNPLAEQQTPDNILLVFDGLDELVMQGKSSKEAANAFMQELKDFCRLKNEGKQRIKIVITGRPIAVQNTEQKLRESEEQILYLLPYFLNENKREDFIDPKTILAKDQRHDWWNRFFMLKNLAHHNLPKELRGNNMDKITTEPLLNYLVALSWKNAPEKFDQDTNINQVYEQLILGVYNREWENKRKYRTIVDLTSDDFIQILEEIAICAWQGGDARITTERKIEKHIKDRGLEALLTEYKASAKGGVSRLLTAFYFRKYGKEESEDKDDTFEFTHKSFGEYLAARALVELIDATHEERMLNKAKATSRRDKRKGWTIPYCLGEWLRMTGKNALDSDISDFIYNEIQLRKEAGKDIDAWQLSLCEVINEVIYTGMPLHLQEQRLSQLEEMDLARNAESALLIALSNCAKVTQNLSVIDWENRNSAGIWFNRLSTSMRNQDFVFRNLNHLNFKGVNLEFSNFSKADFTKSNLQQVLMAFSHLIFANLKGVKLLQAELTNTNLSKSNLSYADLSYANLTATDLIGANLSYANLTATDLLYANLTEADLTGANLKYADLRQTNITLDQLLSTKSLYKTRNIPSKLRDQIKAQKPYLLK